MLLTAQLLLATGGVGWLTLRPPAEGAMLMIPLSQDARTALPQSVIDRGGQLLRMGAFPGSFVVHGRRDAKGRGVVRFNLEVRTNNPATAFYVAEGFVKIGERRDYYRGSSGQAFDALTFQKCLR
ncbi:hypothetical protein [Escherichia coli]|uniref:hypothetical protein n=1 Tax=Escherichia coli TaxID=562 RepID=UPI00190B9AC3|nr:hypothetical protein [Escherichia coli]